MKKLKVNIFKDEKLIGKADYEKISSLQIDDDRLFLEIELSNCNFDNISSFSRNERIAIKILLLDNQFDIINLILSESIEILEKIKFKAEIDQSEFSSFELYSPYSYNIFTRWINNFKPDWRDLNTKLEKEGWIRACGRLIDVTKQKVNNRTIALDFSEVNSLLDFYCLTGEAFLGYKGYIGGDGNAFSNCLYYLKSNSFEFSEILVVFKNFRLIEEKFKKDLDLLNEFKINIINDLESNDLIVKVE